MTLNDGVLIAVDPHKASNTAAVLDPVTKTVIEVARFANTVDGYGQLTTFAARWEQRRWAVEGCYGAGRSLAQRLVADSEMVLDVPAKLAARVRVYSRGHGRKTDKDDAVSVGLAALDRTGILPVTSDDATVSLRLLRPARGTHRAAHPGGVPAAPAAGGADSWRDAPRAVGEQGPGAARAHPPRRRRQQGSRAHCPRPPGRHPRPGREDQVPRYPDRRPRHGRWHRPDRAVRHRPGDRGRILAEVGDVARFATKDAFASYNGTAPIDVSSGDQVRHRLSRAGNRRINHALHMIAVTQIRYPRTPGRLYYERKRREGKTPKEALRCLKRRLPRPGLPPARLRPAGHNRNVRITCDPAADAACIHLTGQPLTPGRIGARPLPARR
jgi:transposase